MTRRDRPPTTAAAVWRWPVLIAVLAAALLALAAVALTQGARTESTAKQQASDYTPPPLPTAATPVTFDQAVARLETPTRPWTLVVVGDSTGYGPDRWVDQLAPLVAAKRDRQVVLHDWNDVTGKYDPARTIGRGGAPITIWNAATPGKTPDYARGQLPELIPDAVAPDVIIVNHGHNTGPDVAHDLSGLMQAIALRFPDAPIAGTVQNPFRGDDRATQKARAAQERAYAEQGGWRVIDVYSAFARQPELAPLYLDDRHENARGGLLWARTVLKATGI